MRIRVDVNQSTDSTAGSIVSECSITKTCLFKYAENFAT